MTAGRQQGADAGELVLVVDDEPAIRSLYARALQDAGYATLEAADGREALELLDRQRVSLVLLDRTMPRLDGLAVLARLRANEATRLLPVILVSAQAELDARVRGLDTGADDYLAKPVPLAELVARVRAQLRGQAARARAFEDAARERRAIAAALARLQPGQTAEATAAVICAELLSLAGVDVAGVISFLDPLRAVPLAVAGPDGLPFVAGRLIPAARAAHLYERAMLGPWAETFRLRSADPLGEALDRIGLRAMAYAPIRADGALLGVVVVATLDEAYARHLVVQLPAVREFAALASALLGGQIERDQRHELVRERVGGALAEGGLSPVFQPIVTLASGEPVGFEALTRFADGTPPDRMIAEAHAVGLGLDLETACLAAALEASDALPEGTWLSLNASPELILHAMALPQLLAGRSRRLVLEVTEHAEIDDYAAVRRAVAGFGPTVSLAVDDAGAGFASLRHIVELSPRFLKLDISLVRHVDHDLTRQAMIAGLSHFARRAGSEVVAEGIETPAELAMLRELGVPLGQGYLLGRPAAVPQTIDEVRGRPGRRGSPGGRLATRHAPSTAGAPQVSGSGRAYPCVP